MGTPWERMQAEKATADGELVDPSAPGDPPEPAEERLPLHAAPSRTRTAVAAIAATDVGGRDPRGRSMTRVLPFIMPGIASSR